MIHILFAADDESWSHYEGLLNTAFVAAGLKVNLARDITPDAVDYIIYAPDSAVQDFTPFTRAKAVLNLWAGVEKIVSNPTLTQPLARMVNSGLTDGMVEWVTGHVLRHHLGLDIDIRRSTTEWTPRIPPLAEDRAVSILGLGALGQAVAAALSGLKFDVAGWSRSPKVVSGITCLSGDDGLQAALARADILVLLLPLTPETENTLNAERLAIMPKGAVILNPGRGPLIDDEALLEALDNGQIEHATLDVFRIEPLPQDHAFWSHPKVTVTPHIAAHTRPESAINIIVENIRRGEAGQPFLHLVDRSAGY